MTPRGVRDAVEGWMRGADGRLLLKVRVAASPADGAANEAVLRLFARAFGRPRGAVRVAVGATARIKQIEVDGIDAADLARAFGAPPSGDA